MPPAGPFSVLPLLRSPASALFRALIWRRASRSSCWASGDAFDDILPPAAAGNAEPQPGLFSVQQGQLRFQLRKVLPQVLGGGAFHFGQRPLLIGVEQLPGFKVRLRLHAPPLFAEQHFQTGCIAVFPGRFRLGCSQAGCAPHHAGDVQRCRRFFLLRLPAAVPQQQCADVLAARTLAAAVVRAGAAGADKAAVFPQPDLRLVQVPAPAAHVGTEMAHAVFRRLAVEILNAIHIRLCPRKDRAAQQVADLVHIHPGVPPFCKRSIG